MAPDMTRSRNPPFSTRSQRAVRGLENAAVFGSAHGGKQLRGPDLGNRARAYAREDVALESAKDTRPVIRRPGRGELSVPFAGDDFEAVGGTFCLDQSKCLRVSTRIDACSDALSCLIPLRAGRFQPHVRVDAER